MGRPRTWAHAPSCCGWRSWCHAAAAASVPISATTTSGPARRLTPCACSSLRTCVCATHCGSRTHVLHAKAARVHDPHQGVGVAHGTMEGRALASPGPTCCALGSRPAKSSRTPRAPRLLLRLPNVRAPVASTWLTCLRDNDGVRAHRGWQQRVEVQEAARCPSVCGPTCCAAAPTSMAAHSM